MASGSLSGPAGDVALLYVWYVRRVGPWVVTGQTKQITRRRESSRRRGLREDSLFGVICGAWLRCYSNDRRSIRGFR